MQWHGILRLRAYVPRRCAQDDRRLRRFIDGSRADEIRMPLPGMGLDVFDSYTRAPRVFSRSRCTLLRRLSVSLVFRLRSWRASLSPA
jgi:hypothetical protein